MKINKITKSLSIMLTLCRLDVDQSVCRREFLRLVPLNAEVKVIQSTTRHVLRLL